LADAGFMLSSWYSAITEVCPVLPNSNPKIRSETLEMGLAGILAVIKGYIVAMPDYQGMKQKTGDYRHPYVVTKPLGRSTVDLLVQLTPHELASFDLK
jgi:hypothetical protein